MDAPTTKSKPSLVCERLESQTNPETLQALKLAEKDERQGLRGIQDLLGGSA